MTSSNYGKSRVYTKLVFPTKLLSLWQHITCSLIEVFNIYLVDRKSNFVHGVRMSKTCCHPIERKSWWCRFTLPHLSSVCVKIIIRVVIDRVCQEHKIIGDRYDGIARDHDLESKEHKGTDQTGCKEKKHSLNSQPFTDLVCCRSGINIFIRENHFKSFL